jgi:hypothetical protein
MMQYLMLNISSPHSKSLLSRIFLLSKYLLQIFVQLSKHITQLKLENLVCDLNTYIVKLEKVLPGVTTVQQNPIIKNYLTRLNAFRTIQFGNLEDIKKKGRKRNYSTPAHAAAVKKPRKLEDSDDDIPVPQQDITLCDSDISEESPEILPVSNRLIAKAEREAEKKKIEAYKQQLAATNKKAAKTLAHANPTTSPIKTEMYSPQIAKSSPKTKDVEDTNEDAKPPAKKKRKQSC